MSLSELNLKIVAVFGSSASKMPNTNSALHKLDLIDKKLQKGTAVDTADAQTHTRDLIDFIRQKAYELADQSQVQALIAGLECYAGITNDTFLLMPEDNVTTFISGSGTAGIQFPATSVDFPTLITLTELPATSSGVLVTNLDKYPGFIEITQQSADPDGNSLKLNQSVTVEVCPVGVPSTEIRGRLRLGHQRAPGASGFDITPPTTASLLNCSTVVGSAASKLPGWMRSLASLVMPKPLYARVMFSGGVGGTAEEFSPFGPVDPMLSLSGGVGGTAEEFIREQPTTPAPAKKQPSTTEESVKAKTSVRSTVAETAVNIITCYQAVVGASAKATGCRPQVTLTTANLLTPFVGVPVTFTVGTLGGSVAADAGSACGVVGSSVTVLTDVNGVARACWTLGDIAGDYTVTATPGNGGDAIAGVSFSLASYTWTTTALKKTATLALGNVAQTYTGSPLGVTVTTTPADLNTVHVTYDAGTTVPTNAGSYAVVATLDNPTYQGTTSGTLVIAKAGQAPLSIKALTAPAVYGTSHALETEGGTGIGAVTYVGSGACTTSGNTLSITSGTGTCTIAATKSGGDNYTDVSASMTVTTSQAEQAPLVITGAGPVAFHGTDVTLGTTGGDGTGAVTFDAGSSTACSVTSTGTVHATTGTGTCTITATKAADANYSAKSAAAATMSITKALATLTLGNLTQGFDGTPKAVSVTTTPVASLATVTVTYDGLPTAPIAAGEHAVIATLANADYEAAAVTGTLNITKATQSISFSGLSARTYGDADFPVGATASSGLAVSFISSGNCTVTGTTVSITGAGSCTVTAQQGGDGNFLAAADVGQSFTIGKATASVTLGGLTATYSSSPIGASVTTSATGSSSFTVTYDGSTAVPVNAGSYPVIAILNNANFSGSTTGTLVIGKASATLTLGSLSATYNGSPKSATVTTSPVANLGSVAFTYDGLLATPSNAGNYAVVATLDNPNYSGSASGTLVIGKASAGVTLSSLTAIYDGAAKSATATTSPSGLGTIGFTYNGSDTAPSNAGSYAVLATLANANYAGGASGTLVISPAGTTITWANPATIILGTPLTGTQLNAYSPSTTGTFAYTPPAGTVLSAGTSTLSTLFTPLTANFSANSASVSIKVFYKQVGCFASPVYSSMPDTKSYQRKGSNLQIKCQLTNASGVGVMNAIGNLKIEDLGLNGNTPTGTPLDIPNAFKVSTSGNYAYGLDTSPANFISLHYYRVTAFWNDGNTTVGWFYIK